MTYAAQYGVIGRHGRLSDGRVTLKSTHRITDNHKQNAEKRLMLLTAQQVAEILGTTRQFVYARQDELGAVRLGQGPKAAMRFDESSVRRFLTENTRARRTTRPSLL